jgi:hypothetical protein
MTSSFISMRTFSFLRYRGYPSCVGYPQGGCCTLNNSKACPMDPPPPRVCTFKFCSVHIPEYERDKKRHAHGPYIFSAFSSRDSDLLKAKFFDSFWVSVADVGWFENRPKNNFLRRKSKRPLEVTIVGCMSKIRSCSFNISSYRSDFDKGLKMEAASSSKFGKYQQVRRCNVTRNKQTTKQASKQTNKQPNLHIY